jgi:hypothetical protein
MSILLKKGQGFSSIYSSVDFPTLTTDWLGSVSLYQAYPGVAVFTKSLTRTANAMVLSLSAGDILALTSGTYYFVTTIYNTVLGITVTDVEYATVTDATVFSVPMTKLYLTIAKMDATPAGSQTKTLTNTADGTKVALGWKGLTVTVSNSVADKNGTNIIDTEPIITTTNAAGYAELYVVKGLTVSVACTGFGKTINVATDGLDSVDLSSYFTEI